MKYMLDTDVFSVLALGRHEALSSHVSAMGTGQLALSMVTEGEIRCGQACRPTPMALDRRIDALLQSMHRLPLTLSVISPYARLRATLHRLGIPIGPNDLWIAAHALAEDLILVTGKDREFARVPGLRVENWLH